MRGRIGRAEVTAERCQSLPIGKATADAMFAKAESLTQALSASSNSGPGTGPRDWAHTFEQDDPTALGVPYEWCIGIYSNSSPECTLKGK